MARQESRTESLTFLPVKEGVAFPDDVLKDPSCLKRFDIVDDVGALGALYVETRGANSPRWSRFFVPHVDASQWGWVSSTAAVLHVPVDGRIMLLTFGYQVSTCLWLASPSDGDAECATDSNQRYDPGIVADRKIKSLNLQM